MRTVMWAVVTLAFLGCGTVQAPGDTSRDDAVASQEAQALSGEQAVEREPVNEVYPADALEWDPLWTPTGTLFRQTKDRPEERQTYQVDVKLPSPPPPEPTDCPICT